jgi:fibronectin-binding autotransporter adhesin
MRFASILALIVASAASGQTFNLTAGTGSWNTAGNWTPAGVPNAIDAAVTFNSPTAAQTVGMNAAITVGTLNFTNNAAAFVTNFNNGTGTLTFDVSAGNAAIVYNGTNSATNNFTISATTTLNDTLQVTNNNTAGTGAATMTFTGAVNGAGGFIKDGLGRVSMSTVAKTYTGATVINQGRLRFTATGVANATSSILVNSGGQLNFGTTGGAFNFGAATITINGTGTAEVAGQVGAIRNEGGGNSTLANAVILGSDSTIDVEGGTSSLQLNGVVSGPGGLTKEGIGTLILGNANTYAGTTTITAGTLQVGNIGIAGTLGAGAVVNNSALIFNRTDDLLVANDISGTGTVTKLGAGTTTLTGTNAYAGITTITAGTLQIGNGGATGTLGAGAVVNNSALIFNRTDDLLVANDISGTGSVSQDGAGATNLTAGNSYSGTTTVNAGTLLINGANTGTGATTVNAGGTLGGSGSMASSVTVNGGTLSPGNSPGNLTLAGLTMNSGTYLWELGAFTTAAPGVDHDLLTVNGAAVLGGTSALQISFTGAATDPNALDPFWTANRQWLILDASGGSLTGTLGSIANPSWTDGSFSLSTAGNQLFLDWTFAPTGVPEPGSLALLAVAGLGAMAWRRRRAVQA